LQIQAIAKDLNIQIANSTGNINDNIILNIKNPKLWSPDSPFLYDLEINLIQLSENTKNNQNPKTIDTIQSYFGMRKIEVAKFNSKQHILLNNKFTFQMGPLDQGFWPDGLYTAPSDAALKWDLEMEKRLGFNMVRKHVKVEPERWYYWTDHLGLLVWQDMPSFFNFLSFFSNASLKILL
jgi:beta-galactosidase/beta-glucuronidase